MHNFNPYFTNDGSVGLYSDTDNDVYHSTFGALTESYEKFILPANFPKYFEKNNEIKILDLCFGIGYNTKSFLNFLIDFLNIETIDTDNIKYNDKIYTDNTNCNKKKNFKMIFLLNYFYEILRLRRHSERSEESHKISPQNDNSKREGESEADGGFKYKIFIHAIDTDKNLVQLSPFITTKNKNIKNNRLPFHNERVEKMISGETKPKYKLHKEINYLLLENVKNCINNDVKSIIFDKKYSQYFDRAVIDFYASKNLLNDILYPLRHLNAFLHNIYYRYISTSHKKALKALKMLDFNFKVSIDDARAVLKEDKYKYNFVFLDAFTPTKCPCLWSVDFFKLIFEHLEDGGMILTYSNSAQVRHAMLDAGFKIYKNVIDDKPQGTVAVKISPSPQPSPSRGEGVNIDKIFGSTNKDKSSYEKFINNDKTSGGKLPPHFEGLCRAKRLSIVLREAFLNENSVRVIEKGWGEGGCTLPLSDYELGLLHTKAGIYFRDENLNLTNEEIIARHEIEVKNSTLVSATKYKKQNML